MDQIGKYEILDKIGSGGFAVVYKGYDPFIKRPVAIKVCYSRDEETRERFHREAEVAGRLEHRNITRIYDFGFHEQMPYLVEEYLSGEDLAHLLRRREPETLEEKVDYLVQIASGLDHAHAQGVIHRDVKPSNVRVLDNGLVKIMDFGTAKLANVESNLTQTGMTLGTVAYLSPQRLLGQDRGSALSDVFSVGVLAYELLSFRRPFPGRSIPSLIDQVLNAAPVPLLESWPECPPLLAELVHRCLEKEPERRYQKCRDLIRDLEEIRLEHTLSALPPSADSSASVTAPISLQALSLLDRARRQLERGRTERAAVLVEEVLEIDPESAEARELLARCQAAGGPPAPPETAPEGPEARRARKIEEARASIGRYVERRELGQAAAALGFATRILGEFAEARELRQAIAAALRQDLATLKSTAVRQARQTAELMAALHGEEHLPPEHAETLRAWAVAIDPDCSAAEQVMKRVREDEARRQAGRAARMRERKQAEAVASIEKMLAEGDPEMAAKALQFAVKLFGEFEQMPALEHRIAEARQIRADAP